MNCHWVAFTEKYFCDDKFSSFFTYVRPLTKLSSAVINSLPKNEKDSLVKKQDTLYVVIISG